MKRPETLALEAAQQLVMVRACLIAEAGVASSADMALLQDSVAKWKTSFIKAVLAMNERIDDEIMEAVRLAS